MTATVLCSDVDRQLFKILERALSDEGYRALPAHDGEQALALVREEPPDLVILDITIPKRDGFDVLREIRRLDGPAGRIPVLLTSSSRITAQYQERARQLGAQALLAKPVPLDDLLEHIRQYVKAPSPRSGAASGNAKAREGTRVEGDLSEIGFPHLLHYLHGLRASGVLMIHCGKKKKAIQLQDGYPVAVKSNLVNECLGNYLVRTGRLEEEALAESLGRMKKGEGLQGQILVAMDVISEDEIATALREQAESKLYEIFEWRRGAFKLEIGSRLQRGNTLALETSPANVILEGVRRWTSGAQVDAFFAANGHRPVRRAASPFYRFQDVELSGAEQKLVSAIDGSRTLAAICGDDEGMRRTFRALIAAELLELEGEPVAVPESEGAAGVAPRPAAPPGGRPPRAERRVREELAALAERFRGRSYFEIFDVEQDAAPHQIESAYERLARKTHPDRFPGASESVRAMAAELFELVSAAHETLIDPQRRMDYITQRRRGGPAAGPAGGRSGMNPEVEFQQGETLLRQRNYERALHHFSRAREAAPRDGEYLAHYAWCFYLCNPDNATVVQEALAHMKRAVKLARDQEKPYLFLGRLCKVVGDSKGAQAMFTRAVQIKPDCVEAMRELRLINMRRDKGRGLIGKLLRR